MNSISDANNRYDILICGSDQLWNPESYTDAYFLKFAGDEKRKIAYDASIGISSLTQAEKAYMKPLIERMDYISVRETQGAELLRSFIEKKEINTAVDPMILVDRNIWNSLTDDKQPLDGKYVFSFFLSPNYVAMRNIFEYAHENGRKVIVFPFDSGLHLYTEEFSDVIFHDCGPDMFLNLIKYADIVFTDSFHATVFSIVFEKTFLCLNRITRSQKQDISSRLWSLLQMCEAQDRMIKGREITASCFWQDNNSKYYYKNLEEDRQRSSKYLNNAFKE